MISTAKNKEMIKDIVLEQITKNIWLSKKYMEYKASGYISFLSYWESMLVLCKPGG